ncbi:hypothetical protein ACPW96_00025 [Micromonospora sp. DT81.3]|uniref:hypothetical protein n=1 Tax=Micromonospora sp. DT81.3 TaxID=3416523 RepID=UPI003CEEBFD0
MNALGHVTGSTQITVENPIQHAVRWTASGGVQDLGTLGGAESAATGINDLGHVIGESDTADGSRHAFRWTQSTGMVDLGPPGEFSSPAAINIRGQVVGDASLTADQENVRAFLWAP